MMVFFSMDSKNSGEDNIKSCCVLVKKYHFTEFLLRGSCITFAATNY